MWRTYSTLSRTTTSRIQPTPSAASSSPATASLLQPRPSSQPTVPSSSLVMAFARGLRHRLKDAHHVALRRDRNLGRGAAAISWRPCIATIGEPCMGASDHRLKRRAARRDKPTIWRGQTTGAGRSAAELWRGLALARLTADRSNVGRRSVTCRVISPAPGRRATTKTSAWRTLRRVPAPLDAMMIGRFDARCLKSAAASYSTSGNSSWIP